MPQDLVPGAARKLTNWQTTQLFQSYKMADDLLNSWDYQLDKGDLESNFPKLFAMDSRIKDELRALLPAIIVDINSEWNRVDMDLDRVPAFLAIRDMCELLSCVEVNPGAFDQGQLERFQSGCVFSRLAIPDGVPLDSFHTFIGSRNSPSEGTFFEIVNGFYLRWNTETSRAVKQLIDGLTLQEFQFLMNPAFMKSRF
jgi:hypothetical protein